MVGGTHLHLFREGYEDKWAYPLDSAEFTNPSDIQQTFREFCGYCHIDSIPLFQEELL